MKLPCTLFIAALWAGYAAGEDKKPVKKCYHTAIHCFYGAFVIATLVFVP